MLLHCYQSLCPWGPQIPLVVGRPCWACTGALGLICFVIPVLDVVLITRNRRVDPVAWGTSSRCWAPAPLLSLHGQTAETVTQSGAHRLSVIQLAQVMARMQRTQLLWGPAAAAPCQAPRGIVQLLSVLPRPRSRCFVFTAFLPRHHLAAKTEHPVQLNQEPLSFNSSRTLSLIILSFSCFYTCKYLIKRNYQQNFSGACRFLFHHQHATCTIYDNNSYHWCDGRATHLVWHMQRESSARGKQLVF